MRRASENTRHPIHGREHEDISARIVALEIKAEGDGFFVFYLDAAGQCLADTWHESLELAKNQAHLEFAIEETDWTDAG